MDREKWLPIHGFTRFYEVSTRGRVRSLKTGHILKPSEDDDGYLRVHLSGTNRAGKELRRSAYVHRLVVGAFIGARPGSGYEVGHKDGNRQNNFMGNLSWVTKRQNAAQRARHGNNGDGSRNSGAKLNEDQVLEIRERHADGETGASLAREFGVSEVTIHFSSTRKRWQHI